MSLIPEFDPLGGVRIFADPLLTMSTPAPNRPRRKKTNKRQSRIYNRKLPKSVLAPSNEAYQMGNCVFMHPVMIEKLKKKIEEV